MCVWSSDGPIAPLQEKCLQVSPAFHVACPSRRVIPNASNSWRRPRRRSLIGVAPGRNCSRLRGNKNSWRVPAFFGRECLVGGGFFFAFWTSLSFDSGRLDFCANERIYYEIYFVYFLLQFPSKFHLLLSALSCDSTPCLFTICCFYSFFSNRNTRNVQSSAEQKRGVGRWGTSHTRTVRPLFSPREPITELSFVLEGRTWILTFDWNYFLLLPEKKLEKLITRRFKLSWTYLRNPDFPCDPQ